MKMYKAFLQIFHTVIMDWVYEYMKSCLNYKPVFFIYPALHTHTEYQLPIVCMWFVFFHRQSLNDCREKMVGNKHRCSAFLNSFRCQGHLLSAEVDMLKHMHTHANPHTNTQKQNKKKFEKQI